ncbi:MAG: hypothetical protein VX938_08535, partial [Myxococcota bacterium]|nr:hypothetical protein [Myxococcota bacterium]
MSEEETLNLALSKEQAEAILQGLGQADGPSRLQFRLGPEGEEETTVLVDAASGELQTGTFEGVTDLEVLLSNTATTAGDLGPVDALGVPWRFAIRPDQQGGSLRSSATDSVFSDLQGLSGHAHLVFIGLQKVVGLRDLSSLADLPALT